MDSRLAVATGRDEDRGDAPQKQRQHFRHPLAALAYVRLDHANGGIIRNISQSGVAIQAVGRLHAGQVVHLRFELLRPKVRVEATGQVAWANEFGQAGIAFLNLPPRPLRALKEWLMTDLLAAASELAPARAPIFGSSTIGDHADGLITGESPLPSIPLVPTEVAANEDAHEVTILDKSPEMPLHFSWWPADIAPRTFAALVDGLVVISAVLLFAIIAIQGTGVLPSFWSAISLAAFFSALFACIYWVLFTGLTGRTLGRTLAKIAAEDLAWMHLSDTPEPDGPRFR